MNATGVLDRYFQELERQDRFSGVVLITQGESRLYAGAYGYANRPWRIKNTLDMRFDAALITRLTEAFLSPQVHHGEMVPWKVMYGYGLWFCVDSSDEVVFYEKEGISAGVSGLICHFPAQDLSVVILSNMEDGAWEPVGRIRDMFHAGRCRRQRERPQDRQALYGTQQDHLPIPQLPWAL